MNALGITIAILGLSLLILVHEFGHFIVGKILGLKVIEFMLGLPLGPKIFGIKRGETTYGVSAVLFGGYVKFAELTSLIELKITDVISGSPAEAAGFLKGDLITEIDGSPVSEWQEVYDDVSGRGDSDIKVALRRDGHDREITIPAGGWSGMAISKGKEVLFDDIPRTFEYQKTWKRGLIVFSGPAMNVLLAMVIIFAVALFGFPKPTTTLAKVMDKSPAAAAGIKAGDKIISIGGKRVDSWEAVTRIINEHAGEVVSVIVIRDGRRISSTPRLRAKSKSGLLGIMTKVERQRQSIVFAAKQSYHFIWQTTLLMVNFIAMIFTNPSKVLPYVRSPIGIVKETAPIAQSSIIDYLTTLAGLSVAIGIFNLLPLPPLDGGRLFISGVEGIIRRPISRQAMIAVNALGFSLLLVLMTYAIVGDVFRKAIPGGG